MTEAIAALLGLIVPPFVDLLTKKISSSNVRFWVSILFCLGVAVLINLNNLSTKDIFESLGTVVLFAQMMYQTYWKNSDLRSQDNK